MAQIVEADRAHPGRLQCLLEATHERAMGEHFATQRIGEDEVILAAEARMPKVDSQLVFYPSRKGYRAFAAARLRG
jgi:hypothetical protein